MGKSICIRVTEEEFEYFNTTARALNISRSDYIKNLCLSNQYKKDIRIELLPLLIEAANILNDLKNTYKKVDFNNMDKVVSNIWHTLKQ